VRYFGCRLSGKLVALSSAEMDSEGLNVEMTDFATLPDYRGHGLAAHLLARMEAEMADAGMLTAYTIARAYSFGMNITFARAGYEFAGTLTNNTNISGGIESMNVWWKRLG
jgi:putative beta-lysine N-acetyltransferase